ncbi:hypothetical protein WJX72_009231 [[Myrmecia] bisecta]|uniref:Uncharacterized protein n=1 Tax=[Myrmecia] bisecta TaxID=41462 RepID=A0AAW1Q4A3_9CHLO
MGRLRAVKTLIQRLLGKPPTAVAIKGHSLCRQAEGTLPGTGALPEAEPAALAHLRPGALEAQLDKRYLARARVTLQ